MNNSKFKIGDRVGVANQKFYFENKPQLGVVSDVSVIGKICVTWDRDYQNRHGGNPYQEESCYITEEEANARWNVLENEWQILEAKIKEKLKVASDAIRESAALAKANKYNLTEMWEATRSLMSALDDVGWSTSSMSC